jgi:hypothetical protein
MFEKKLSLLADAGVWDCEGLNWFTEEEGVGSVCVHYIESGARGLGWQQ